MMQNNLERKNLLSEPIRHIDITSFDARPIIDGMRSMSFTARSLARACDIFNAMLQDPHCSIILTLAGSSSAGGCMNLFADMLKYNMVDAVVSTGASIVDMDFFEALGFLHYRGSCDVDDTQLRDLQIDRIYDTYIDENQLQICDQVICDIAQNLENKPYSSRAFIQEMGRWLASGAAVKKNSLVQTAFEKGIPVFCPAFTDCSAGFGLVKHQVSHQGKGMTIDSIADFRELTEMKIKAQDTGLLMIGGGVPKNFAQDTVVCAELIGHPVNMHRYAVQVTVADVRDGACSSSTLKEAASWGKVEVCDEQMVFAEATSVLPLLVSDAYFRGHWRQRKERRYADLFQS